MLERLGVKRPWPDAAHRQRRGGDGHGQPAAVRHARHPHRRHRIGARRQQEPARRRAAGHPPARRDGNVYAVAQGSVAIGGFQAEGEAAKNRARRADRRPHFQRRADRARNRIHPQQAQPVGMALRNPDFTTGQAHRRGHQRLHRHADGGAAGSGHDRHQRSRSNTAAT